MTTFIGRSFRGIFAVLGLAAFLLAQPAAAAPFAAIVMDARTGEVLYEKNADSRLHPASLTKMMTLYIIFQEIEAGRLSLDQKVTISAHAASQPPSRLGLKAGQKIALRYLIRAAAVKSANDAAMALGELVGGGSEAAFAKRMTKTAKALGMRSTTFKNPNGLTAEGHLSTARDMNILGRHLFYDFPQYYNIFSRRTADAGLAKVTNTNSRFLDGYEGADGIKTGYTVAAGFNLTASAKRGNVRLIATIFGSTSTAARNAKMAELMDMGFGLAKKGVREKKPEAAPLPDDALIAAANGASLVDEPGVEGGAGKTIRISGAVSRSLRPKARPVIGGVVEGVAVAVAEATVAPEVPDALAAAIAEGVESALAEATTPPPSGTLEAQAMALAEAPALADAAEAEAPAVAAVIEDTTEEPQLAEAATDGPVVPDGLDAPAGSLEAQAAALAAAPPALVKDTLDAQAVALAEASAVASGTRPQPRPEAVAAAAAPAEPPAAPEMLAEAAPALETVAPAADPVAEPVAEAATALALIDTPAAPADEAPIAGLTSVQEAVASVTPEALIPPEAPVETGRAAPIFEPVQMAEATPEEAKELVVVSKSTSGGRHWGVNVGAYSSRSEAERALLKTGLAESATLTEGLKKITEKGGKYRASFLGLSEDQADLACRRLRARGMLCETMGPA
uniref:serine hydrolase n=1 Tax=Xinfangfangia pollutisoli TaxID=2865960 RepID=UPI001CD5D304|nr:serine hydrolase [Xinfangfangia pollutisoli]